MPPIVVLVLVDKYNYRRQWVGGVKKPQFFSGSNSNFFLDPPKSLSSGKITHTNIDKRSRNSKKTLNHAKNMSSSNHVLLPKHSARDKKGCRQKLS